MFSRLPVVASVVSAALVSVLLVNHSVGQEPREPESVARETVSFRHLIVPADQPESWPLGDWVPVRTEEYLRLRSRLSDPQAQPPAAFLERVVYRATFADDALRAGTFSATGRLRADVARLIDLEEPTIAIDDIRTSGVKATWGTDPAGRSRLRIDSDHQDFTGRWSLAGERVFQDLVFAVSLPPAIVSRLEIDVPNTHSLSVDIAATQQSSIDRNGWTRWSVDLGRRTSCQVTLSPIPDEESTVPIEVQASQAVQYSLREDGLNLQADVIIENQSRETEELQFTATRRLQFAPVTLGTDVTLPSRRLTGKDANILAVDVRGVDLSQRPTIRLRAVMPMRLGQSLSLPRIGLRGGRWLGLRRTIIVTRPLELNDVTTTDCRLLSATMSETGNDTLEYEAYSRKSSISVNVDNPQPDVTATVLSLMTLGELSASRDSLPLLKSALLLKARSGALFNINCRIPPGWEITHVRSTSETPIAQWRVIEKPEGDDRAKQLVIDLRRALTPQMPVDVVVWARRTDITVDARMPSGHIDVPTILPMDASEMEVIVMAESSDRFRMKPVINSAYVSADLDQLLTDWGGAFPGPVTKETAASISAIKATNPPLDDQVQVEASSATVPPATADTVLDTVPSTETVSSSDRRQPNEQRARHAKSLQLTTVVDIDGGRLCRTTAAYEFPPSARLRSATLSLPSNATLMDAVLFDVGSEIGDRSLMRESATELANTVVVALPPSLVAASLRVTYESPLTTSLFDAVAAIPLPKWDGNAESVTWTIELPDDYRLKPSTSGSGSVGHAAVSWSERILGPLGRKEGTTFAWPFTVEYWQVLLADVDSGNDLHHGASMIARRSLSGDQTALVVSLSDTRSLRRFGWLTLLVSLLATAVVRRLTDTSWQSVGIVGGVVMLASTFAPDALAVPLGGSFVGLTMGLLIPRRWCRPAMSSPVRLRRTEMTSTLVIPPMRASIVLVAGGIGLSVSLLATLSATTAWGWQPTSRPPAIASTPTSIDVLIPASVGAIDPLAEGTVVYLRRDRRLPQFINDDSLPPYLIRSAVYSVDTLDRDAPLRAVFELIVLNTDGARHVALPLSPMTFDKKACFADETPVTLLPHRSQDGVVVDLSEFFASSPTADESVDSGKDDRDERTRPDEPVIRLTMVGTIKSETQESPDGLTIEIPPLLNSRALFRVGDPKTPNITVDHRGATNSPAADGLWRVSLGRLNRLTARPKTLSRSPDWLTPVAMASFIEAHPLRLQIQSRVTFSIDEAMVPQTLPAIEIELPVHAHVREVTGERLRQTRLSRPSRGPLLVHLSLLPNESPLPKGNTRLTFDLRYDLPVMTSGQPHELPLPPLQLLTSMGFSDAPPHEIGVAAASGFRFGSIDKAVPDNNTNRNDDSDNSSVERDLTPSGSALAALRGIRESATTFRLVSPQTLTLPVRPMAPDLLTSFQQTLTVGPRQIDWRGQLVVDVRDAAVATHTLTIDPRLRVTSVTVQQDDVDRLTRWSQPHPDQLTLLLSEDLAGLQTIEMTGLMMPQDERAPLPTIAVDGAISDRPTRTTIQHAPGVRVGVFREEGTPIGPADNLPSNDHLTTESYILTGEEASTARFSISVQETQAPLQLIDLFRRSPEGLTWTRRWQFPEGDTTARRFEATLPIEMAQGFEIAPAGSLAEQVLLDDGRLKLVFDVPAANSAVALTSRLTPAPQFPWTPPNIPVSAPLAAHHLVLLSPDSRLSVVDRDVHQLSASERENLLPSRVAETFADADGVPSTFEVTGVSGSFSIDLTHTELSPVTVTRLESVIWEGRHGKPRNGLTLVDVDVRRDTAFTLDMPPQLFITRTTLNGALTRVTPSAGFHIRLSDSTARSQRVIVWWQQRGSRSLETISLPRPLGLTATAHDVLYLGRPDVTYRIADAIESAVASKRLLQKLSDDESGFEKTPLEIAFAVTSKTSTNKPAVGPLQETGSLVAARLQEAGRFHLRSWPFSLVRLTLLLGVAMLGLFIWAIAGQWSNAGWLSLGRSDQSSLPIIILLTAVGIGASSLAGLCLLSAAGVLCAREFFRWKHSRYPATV